MAGQAGHKCWPIAKPAVRSAAQKLGQAEALEKPLPGLSPCVAGKGNLAFEDSYPSLLGFCLEPELEISHSYTEEINCSIREGWPLTKPQGAVGMNYGPAKGSGYILFSGEMEEDGISFQWALCSFIGHVLFPLT